MFKLVFFFFFFLKNNWVKKFCEQSHTGEVMLAWCKAFKMLTFKKNWGTVLSKGLVRYVS